MKPNNFPSRYGVPRTVTSDGDHFIFEGEARYYRVGTTPDGSMIAYFDPEGGPFIAVGDRAPEFNNETIAEIAVEQHESEGYFRIRVRTEP